MLKKKKSEKPGKTKKAESSFVVVQEGQATFPILPSIHISRPNITELRPRVLSEVKAASRRREEDQKW